LASPGVPFDRLCDRWNLHHRIIDPQVAWKQTTTFKGGFLGKTHRLFRLTDLQKEFCTPSADC
jgi:hypothetical protein